MAKDEKIEKGMDALKNIIYGITDILDIFSDSEKNDEE